MQFTIKTTFLITLALLSIPEVLYKELKESQQNVTTTVKEITHSETHYVSNYQFEKGYEEAIAFIKEHEGFANGEIYYDAAGNRTIGYGHLIKAGEEFPEKITKQEAENLLRKDFDKAIWHVENSTNLRGYKKIAMAHFIYARGVGNFLRSNLRKKIANKEPIEEELLRWVYYKSPDGELVESNYIKKIRLWEVDMYNRGS
jgi:GH24 family phage-related lysozyme (muramidase)